MPKQEIYRIKKYKAVPRYRDKNQKEVSAYCGGRKEINMQTEKIL